MTEVINKLKRRKCDMCPGYFIPNNHKHKHCHECTQKAKNLASERWREKQDKTTNQKVLRGLRALKPSNGLKQIRICLGTLCRGEKTFMSKGTFNRVCERCEAAEENVGGRFVNVANYQPLSFSRDVALKQV
jgi:hypothetical protein